MKYRISLDDVQQPGHLETSRGHRDHAIEPPGVTLGETQRDAATERVADHERGHRRTPGGVPHRRCRERIELGQDRIAEQRIGGAESRQVDSDGAPALPGEQGERVTPRIGAVGIAVKHDHRRSVTLELEHARLVPGKSETVLEQRLDHRAPLLAPLPGCRGSRFRFALGRPVGDEVASAHERE